MEGPSVDPDDLEPRLYLIGPSNPEVRSLVDRLSAVLSVMQPAAFLLNSMSEIDRASLLHLQQLCRERATAFLIQDDERLAQSLGADGVHIAHRDPPRRIRSVRQALQEGEILGVDVGLSRHDAMVAGEDGVDYVAIGYRGQPVDQTTLDFVAWWRELVVLPSLTYAGSVQEAARLVEAGADFIGVGEVIWRSPDGAVAAASRFQALIEKNGDLGSRKTEAIGQDPG